MQALTFLLFINWSKKYVIFLLRLIEHIQAHFFDYLRINDDSIIK